MVHDGRDSQVSRRFLLRLCITALSNKTKMSQQNENKTVRGREKERKSHSRYCHWFGLWRDPIDGCRLEVAVDNKGRSWLATSDFWRQIIGDSVRSYTAIFISVLCIDWFFLEVFLTRVNDSWLIAGPYSLVRISKSCYWDEFRTWLIKLKQALHNPNSSFKFRAREREKV